MPRSPVFLISKGKNEEARKALQFLRGKGAKIDGELAQLEEDVKQSASVGAVSPLQLFSSPQYLKPMAISLVLMSLQQLSGINYVLSYSTLIFKVFKESKQLNEQFFHRVQAVTSIPVSALCLLVLFKLPELFLQH